MSLKLQVFAFRITFVAHSEADARQQLQRALYNVPENMDAMNGILHQENWKHESETPIGLLTREEQAKIY